jgi:antitoxin Phd
MRSWLVKDARAHLSELMEAALDGEPQRVTRRGKGAVVVVGEDDWARLTARASRGRARSFGEHLAKFPLSREEWDAVAPKRAGMTSVPLPDRD